MTEAEWLACDDPLEMIRFLGDAWRERMRKRRLFACACVRRIWHLLLDERSRRCVETVEGFPETEQEAAIAEAIGVLANRTPEQTWGAAGFAAWAAVLAAAGSVATARGARAVACWSAGESDGLERLAQVALLQDIAGSPFRPVSFAPAGLPATITAAADTIYAAPSLSSGHLDPVHLAILADALENAGCTDDAILSHLRSPGPHVRGCWALDLILGKS